MTVVSKHVYETVSEIKYSSLESQIIKVQNLKRDGMIEF